MHHPELRHAAALLACAPLLLVVSSCSADRPSERTGAASAGSHDPNRAIEPPTCNSASCSATPYYHRHVTCTELGLSGEATTVQPFGKADETVVRLAAAAEITFTATSHRIERHDGSGETRYRKWSFEASTPIDAVILHGDPASQNDSNVFRFQPGATIASGLMGSWFGYGCSDPNDLDDSCLYPFEPVAATICYRARGGDGDDGGADGRADGGGKTW